MAKIEIRIAREGDAALLALLGRITYVESHGQFIASKKGLTSYVDMAFSVSKTRKDIANPNHFFYILYVDLFPVGYVKLIANESTKRVDSQNSCRLERIYMLQDFIHLKLGQQLLEFIMAKAKALQLDTMWLTVYSKNLRAIRFYKKNGFVNNGQVSFLIDSVAYENEVLTKNI